MIQDGAVVEIASGGLRGAEGKVRAFKGVPYAAPPIGALRWRPPQPATAWRGVRDALQYGPICPQPGNKTPGAQSEDCLTLNVWAPAEAHKLPVMVWFHGGGWRRGAGSSARTNGESLARQGVVVVTVNFRLGIIGFMAHPALSMESLQRVSSNYGLLDIIAALEWVRDNITAFGGDPQNVTAFGQSSGAQAICDLMISPLARGLFHRAILQSAPVLRPGYAQMTLSQAEEEGRRYGDDIRLLRETSAEELLALTPVVDYETRANIPNPHYPVLDGYVLPTDERTAFRMGAVARMPVMIGANVDEARHYMENVPARSLHEYPRYLKRRFLCDADEAARLYPATNDETAMYAQGQITADTSLNWGVREFARCAALMMPTYRYLYAHARRRLAPTHSDEIPLIFGNEVDRSGKLTPFTASDRRVSTFMQHAWTNFAGAGDPNGSGIAWRPFDLERETYLKIDDAPEHQSCWRNEQVDFIGRTTRR